jgi:hypothetical protein
VPLRSSTPLAAVVALTALCVALVQGCSDPDRTAGRFCAELQAELPSLTAPPTSSGDVDALVRTFKKLNAITPLAIEEEWQVLTDLVEMASDVIPSDPASRQELADAAYKAERPAREMTFWVESTCGFLMPDVIGIEGNRAP